MCLSTDISPHLFGVLGELVRAFPLVREHRQQSRVEQQREREPLDGDQQGCAAVVAQEKSQAGTAQHQPTETAGSNARDRELTECREQMTSTQSLPSATRRVRKHTCRYYAPTPVATTLTATQRNPVNCSERTNKKVAAVLPFCCVTLPHRPM